LHQLGRERDKRWTEYLNALKKSGQAREPKKN
jgi:DUF971 family protein